LGQDSHACADLPRRAAGCRTAPETPGGATANISPRSCRNTEEDGQVGRSRALALYEAADVVRPWYFGDAITDSARLRMQHPKSILPAMRVPEGTTRTPAEAAYQEMKRAMRRTAARQCCGGAG